MKFKRLWIVASLMSLSFVTLIQTVSTPDASRVYADRFIPEVLAYQAIGVEGTLDGSFGTTGSLSLAGQFTSSQAKSVKILVDGSIIVLLDDGTDSKIVKYKATGDVQTSGFGSSGIVLLSGLTGSQTMIVDSDDRIIVTGSTDAGGNPWIRRFTAAGVLDSTFALINGQNWSFIGGIAQQTSGRLIFVGQEQGTGYARIVGYTSTGVIDTTFGTDGEVIFDGGTGHALSTNALYTVSIASDDSIFVGYKNGSAYLAKLDVDGALVSAFNSSGVLPGVLPNALGSSSVTAAQIRVALASDGNICIAGKIGNDVIVLKYNSTTGAVVGAFSMVTITDAADVLNISDLLALSDGKLVVVGYNSTDLKMRVTQITSVGAIDTTAFNVGGTPAGNNEFSIGSPTVSSILHSGAVSPDGRLYVAGYQSTGGGPTITPYVSRIFDELYVSSVAQFPVTVEQGDLDLNFGTNSSETYRGINYLFNGKYGATLQQQTNAVIELASGKVLVGMTGKLNTSNNSNMMLTRLNAAGTLDTTFNTTGKLAITQVHADEYLTSIIEDKDANILVGGYSDSTGGHAILRKLDSDGVLVWAADDAVLDGTNHKVLSVGIQATQRILLFMQSGATSGKIVAINPSTGAIDTTFNSPSGQITTADFGLTNMGAVYGAFVDMQDNIMIAYRNSSSTNVDVVSIFADGSRLNDQFGTDGVITGAFTAISAGNVRLAMDNDERFLVGVADGANFKLKRYYLINGVIDPNFGTSGLFSFSAGTAAVLNQLTTLSNNKIVITGANDAADDAMLICRVTSTGALDTTFNVQGSTQGILSVQVGNIVSNYYSRQAKGLVVQAASGNMIVVGNEQQTSSTSIPMIARVYGQSSTTQVKQSPVSGTGVAGTVDSSFGSDDNGAIDLTTLIGAGSLKTVYAHRSTSANQGKMLLGIDTADNTVKISRFNEYNETLDSSFGTAGVTTLTTLSGLSGLKHVSLDANNKIIVGGTFNGNGWAKRLTVNGVMDIAFVNLINLVEINEIYQQKSGRYIVVGRDSSGRGVLVAFQDLAGDDGYLDVDTTFNPLGSIPGWYTIGTSGLYNLAINSDDTLLVAYADTTVKVAKITANGSGLVTSFATSGILNTGMTPKNLNDETRLAIDSNGKIIVATSVGVGGTSVSVARYSSAGVIDSGFNGGAVKNITGLGSVGVTLADIIITDESTANDKIILLGSNTAGGNGRMFVSRLDVDGTLDAVFNKVPTGADVAGILTFTLDSSIAMYRGSIYIDGTIYAAGAGSGDKPVLMAIFGDDYIGQTEEQPFEVAAGIIDTTLDYTGGTGALNLVSYLTSTLDLSGYVVNDMHIYDSGAMLIAMSNYYADVEAYTSVIVKLNAAHAIDITFNSAGTPGYVTISDASWVSEIYVADGTDDDGGIYVTGYTSTSGMMTHKFSATGVDLDCSVTDNDERYGYAIRVSSNRRIMVATVADNEDSSSVIVAYKPDGSARDLSFGNNGNGEYEIGIESWWLDSMSIDSEDRLYFAYPPNYPEDSSGNITVARLKANGTDLDAWSAFGTAISVTDARFVRTVLDETNNRLVVAILDGADVDNVIKVRRYNATTGANDGGLVSITVAGKELELSDLFIDEDQQIYVLATNRTDNKVVVARITSSMALDTTYATTGIANVNTGANLKRIFAGIIAPDRRVYVGGMNAAQNIPSIARFFGDAYTLQESQATFKAIPGTPDVTLDPNAGTPDAGIVISGLTGYTGYAVYENADGSSYVAFGNGTNVRVGKLNADYVLVSSGFGTAGLTTAVAMATVNNLIVDASGKIVVVGTNAGAQKILRFPTDGTAPTTFVSTTSMSVGIQVVQQKSGRYLVAGLYASNGTILAYKNDGLATDTTYGPAANAGRYATGTNSQIDDMLLDSNDNAYIVFRDTSNHVILQKISANGAEQLTEIDTEIIATSAAHLAINSAGNILIGASTASGIKTGFYDGVTLSLIQTVTSANSPVLTRMVGVGTKFASAAYTTAPAMLTILQTSTGILDTAFNPDGTTPGIASSDPESATQMNGISVQPDGKFVMVGKQITPSVNPVLMSVYGNPYVTQVAQYPGTATVGTLDTTLYPTTGALNLDGLFDSLNLDGYTARRIYAYSNNNLLLACDNGTNSIIVRVYKDFTLDTTFNTVGYLTIFGKTGVTGLYVDENNNIFVVGGSATSWLRAYNNDGSTLTGFTFPTTNLSAGAYAVELQSLNRIVVPGRDATGGVLYGYTSTTGELDTEFGNGTSGIYKTLVAAPIADISIDNLDRIAIVYSNSGSSVLARVNSDGSGVDALGGPTAITGVTGNQLQVLNDNDGQIIVAAATTTGFTLRRYNTNGIDSPGAAVTISAGTAGTSVLGTIYTTSDNKTVLIGYESVTNNIIIARLTNTFVLDTAFNPNGSVPGVLSTTVGLMTIACSGTIYNDDRILVIGSAAGGTDPFMARVFGDDYVTTVKQSDTLGLFGALDTTYATSGANSLGGTLVASIPYAIRTSSDGSVYFGVEAQNLNQTTTIMKLNGQGTAVSAFGTSGLLPLTEGTFDKIRDMQFDHNGKLLATGGSTSTTWALRLNPTTGAVINTFINSSMKTRVGVLEQTNDRIVIAGSNSSDNGVIVGYTPDGSALDIAFGPTSTGYFTDSTNINAPITSMAIDNVDRMFVGYTKSSRAAVACVRANGTAVDASYDDHIGFATTGFIADVFGSTNISGNVYVAVDSGNNVIVAAVNNAGADIVVKKYNSVGASIATTAISSLTTPILRGIMVTNTNEIMLFGNHATGVFSLQLDSDLVLDTTFGTGGIATYTVSSVISLRSASLTVDGTFYLGGNNSSNGPLLIRAYSDRFIGQNDQQPTDATPGTFDVSLNGTGGILLTDRSAVTNLTGYAGKAMYAYSNSDKLLMALDNGISTKLIRTDADGFLDTSFGTNGFAGTTAPTGVSKIEVDASGKILVVGTSWVRRYAADGNSIETFATPSAFTNGSDVAQQKSGRVLVSGYDSTSSQGALIAWQSTGAATDKSFGLVSQSSPRNDRYLTGVNSNIDSFVVNNDDTIVIAYKNSNSVTLRKLNANGSSYVSSFGDSLGIKVAVNGTSVSGKVFLIKDENQGLIVAARTNTNEITVVRYGSNGGSVEMLCVISTITAPVITGLEETSTGQVIVSGYNGSGNAFVARLQSSNYALESNFGTSGIFTGTVSGLNQVNASQIRLDGRIALLGQDISANPILLSVIGDPYVSANTTATQQPSAVGVAGVLDTTFDATGALNLHTALSAGGLDLTGSIAQQLHVYDDGTMLIAFTKSNSTIVVKLHKDQTLDTTGFGSGTGFVTIANASVVNDMFVDDATNSDGSIYLTGTHAGSIWTRKLSAAGVDQTFNVPNTLSMVSAYRIRKSTNNRILVAGKTGSLATISAYTSDGSALDLSFGNGTGAFQVTGVNNPIVDMQLDSFDRIYASYIDNDGNLIAGRLFDNGGSAEFAVIAVTPTYGLSTTQIKSILDEPNNQIIGAIQDGTSAGNIIKVRRFSMIDGSPTGSLDTITIPGKVLNLTDLFVDAAQNIYVIGYNSTDSNVVVARITSTSSTTIALDTSYATTGIANVNAGANLTIVKAGIIDLDNRVYVVGQNGTPIPSMARLFGDAYNLERTQANPEGLLGELDLTLDASTGGIVLSSVTSFGTNLNSYTGRAIFANADGSSYVAFGNGTNVIVGKLDCDQQPVTSGFGTAGLTTAVTMAVVNSLAVDASGRILVAGTNGGASKVLRYPTNGASPEVFVGVPALVVGNRVVEQKSGRILLSGRKTSGGSYGVVFAYQNTGLAADITFGPHGSDGFYAIDVNQPIDDMVVDSHDKIYIVYRDTTVKIQKLTANGSRRDTIFAGGAIVNTGIVATNTAHIAINEDGDILVGAPVGVNIQTALYDGTLGTIVGSVQTIADETPVLTQITGVNSEFVMSGYQTTGGAQMLTILIGADGELDTDFAGDGIAETATQSANQMNSITVQPDGRFLMVGQKTVATVNYPVLERVYGTPYVDGDSQFPGTAVVGTLDATLLASAGGDLDLTLLLPTAGLTGYTAKRMYDYADAKVLLAFDNGTHTKLVRTYKDGTLDTTFNTVGYMTLSNLSPVTSLYIDQYNNIFVAGSTSGISSASWVRGFSNTGAAISFVAPTTNLSNGCYAMEQQTLGRTIIAGAQGLYGSLIGYDDRGAVDTEFGTSGQVTLATAAPIADMTIDGLDRIVIGYVLAGSSAVKRFDATGTIVDTTLGTPSALTGITGNELRVIQDNADNLVIGVATSTGFKLRRYSSVNGSTLSTSNSITAAGVSHLGNIYATSDDKIVLVGYTESGNVLVARFNADLSLDDTFNPDGSPAGVLLTGVGIITSIHDGSVYADDRIYIVGGGSNSNPHMARVFGDDYVSDLSQSPVYGTPGTLDLTLGTAGNGAFELNTLTGVGTSVPKAIQLKADGSMIIAMQKALNNTLLVNIKNNLTLDTAGVIDITTGAPGVKALTLDALARILVTGNSGSASWIGRYNATSGAAVGTFPSIATMTSVVNILTQSNGRVIVGGDQDSTHGLLVGLAPLSFVSGSQTTTPALDTTYGSSSRFTSSSIGSINSFAIDSKDRVVAGFVGTGGSTVKVARVRPNGSGLDTEFNGTGLVTTNITTASGTKPVRVALDNDENIVVASTTATGISVRRYNDAGTIEDIAFNITNVTTGMTSPVITQLLTTVENQIILLGYENIEDGNMFAMRLNSAGIIDPLFNPDGLVQGLLTFKIHNDNSSRTLYAGAVAPDGRILAVAYEDEEFGI